LVEVITGLRSCSGKIWMEGKNIANKPPAFSISQGLAHVPEDRIGVGSAPNLTLTSNIIMKRYDQEPLSHKWQLNYLAADELAKQLKGEYDIQAPSIQTQARKLSGGNLQKLILARELSNAPRLIMAMQPTRGLDVGAIESVQQLLLLQREQGCGILLVSEDLDELLALSDRIAVMYEGEIVGMLQSDDFDITKIGLMMTGTRFQDLPPSECAALGDVPVSTFDETLQALKTYEAAQQEAAEKAEIELAQAEEQALQEEQASVEGEESPAAEEEENWLPESEKDRVLRKVLGEKYKGEGEE
jgi:simple sugar transport system ATP-binding protein